MNIQDTQNSNIKPLGLSNNDIQFLKSLTSKYFTYVKSELETLLPNLERLELVKTKLSGDYDDFDSLAKLTNKGFLLIKTL